MKRPVKSLIDATLFALALFGWFANATGFAQATKFQHVIVIFQENRTPDNLFHDPKLIAEGANIASTGIYKNKSGVETTVPLRPVALANTYDLSHKHMAFEQMYDNGAMDGANLITCTPNKGTTCPTLPQFMFVDNSTGTLQPYFDLAEQYGFANRMFQTNQGPSFPAHQFIFSGTSAPVAFPNAYYKWFAAENPNGDAGCTAAAGSFDFEISPAGKEYLGYNQGYPCYDHPSLPDLFPSGGTGTNWWTYYTELPGSIWTAPNAISHICQSSGPGGSCEGAEWKEHVSIGSQIGNLGQVLTDIRTCKLAKLSWVIPDGAWSDHAAGNSGYGPAWVADIVDEIGNSYANSKHACDYWGTETNDTTAILIAWDDWGGWYDHVKPEAIGYPNGTGAQYVYGFRVPLLVVSAYTKQVTTLGGYISTKDHDFGSILHFIEEAYGLGTISPAYHYADAFADDLSDFFDYSKVRSFKTIPSPYPPSFFINYTGATTDPDND
jgi:phospholipase C